MLCRYCDKRCHSDDDCFTKNRDQRAEGASKGGKAHSPQEINVICDADARGNRMEDLQNEKL